MEYGSMIFFVLMILTVFGTLEGFYGRARINDRYAALALLLLYAAFFLPPVTVAGYEIYIFSVAAAIAVFLTLFFSLESADARLSAAALGLTEALLLSIFPLRFSFVLDSIFMGYMLPLGALAGFISGLFSPGAKSCFASAILSLLLLEPFLWDRAEPSAYITASWGGSLFSGLMAAFLAGGAIRLLRHAVTAKKGKMLSSG